MGLYQILFRNASFISEDVKVWKRSAIPCCAEERLYGKITWIFVIWLRLSKICEFALMWGRYTMKNEYNGGLTREQFLFYEIRIVSSLYVQGNAVPEEVRQLIEFPVKIAFTADFDL